MQKHGKIRSMFDLINTWRLLRVLNKYIQNSNGPAIDRNNNTVNEGYFIVFIKTELCLNLFPKDSHEIMDVIKLAEGRGYIDRTVSIYLPTSENKIKLKPEGKHFSKSFWLLLDTIYQEAFGINGIFIGVVGTILGYVLLRYFGVAIQ